MNKSPLVACSRRGDVGYAILLLAVLSGLPLVAMMFYGVGCEVFAGRTPPAPNWMGYCGAVGVTCFAVGILMISGES